MPAEDCTFLEVLDSKLGDERKVEYLQKHLKAFVEFVDQNETWNKYHSDA